MPPLAHPPGMNFLDDQEQRPVNVDAATYYGGQEYHSRARTYSAVCLTQYRLFCLMSHAVRLSLVTVARTEARPSL